jgi:hypothetical protein
MNNKVRKNSSLLIKENSHMTQDLHIKSGENIILSPKNPQFAGLFKKVQPNNIDEVKAMLGLKIKPTPAKVLRLGPNLGRVTSTISERTARSRFVEFDPSIGIYRPPKLTAQPVSFNELHASDKRVQARARDLVYRAAHQYVYGDSQAVSGWVPIINDYLKVLKAIVNWMSANTIIIEHGGTLTIAADTQLVEAWQILMYGSGQIVCQGNTTIRVISSLQGNL